MWVVLAGGDKAMSRLAIMSVIETISYGPVPGSAPRSGFMVGRPRRDWGGEGVLGERKQELGVGRAEMERDRARRVVRDDASGEVADARASAAGGGADEVAVQENAPRSSHRTAARRHAGSLQPEAAARRNSGSRAGPGTRTPSRHRSESGSIQQARARAAGPRHRGSVESRRASRGPARRTAGCSLSLERRARSSVRHAH